MARSTLRTVCMSVVEKLPVSMMPGLELNHVGKTRPLKVEKPRMRRLREEFRSTYWGERKRKGDIVGVSQLVY